MNLFRPEVSIETRAWNLRSLAVDHGHAFGNPTGIGVDNIPGRQDREFSNTVASPTAFFSGRLSLVAGGRLEVFHHQLVNYQMTQETQGAFFRPRRRRARPAGAPPFCEVSGGGRSRIFPARHEHEVGITSSGVGVAFRYS